MKDKLLWSLLIVLVIAAFASTYTTYHKVTAVMDRQQHKIEMLKEDNARLTDEVWGLSQELMELSKD